MARMVETPPMELYKSAGTPKEESSNLTKRKAAQMLFPNFPKEEVSAQPPSKMKEEEDEEQKPRAKKKKSKKPMRKKKIKKMIREKMKPNDSVRSESYRWRVIKLLGSGGFGDVYKVVKENDQDTGEYAMKTEMVEGDKRMLRLKIEVCVLSLCHEAKKQHFVAFVDRGKNRKFKFLVMGLVGPSLEDIRKNILMKNYSKTTAMNVTIQTLDGLRDLHNLGYLHRDIKPQNYAVGLGAKESVIYLLDFGIARKYTIGNTKDVKIPRKEVKFLGTLRFAARACHQGVDQGRRDDLETWIYMSFDLFDEVNGLPWKRAVDRNKVLELKLELFKKKGGDKVYSKIPKDMARLLTYIDEMQYADEPDYDYMRTVLVTISKEQKIDFEKKLDWIGKCKRKKKEDESSDETSEDRRQSGSDDHEDDGKKRSKLK